MAKHARLSPSKADLWMVCPGGIPFAESLADQLGSRSEDVSSPAAAAGTMAHEYSEETILSHLHPEESVRDLHRENANVIRPKMEGALLKNAEMYASWAVGFVSTHPNIPWGVELSAPLWYEPRSKGTADFWAVDGDTLIVVDYKSGRIKVEVENNLQIAIYLIAIYDEIKAFNPQINKFRAGVHQPFSMREGKRDPYFWDFDMEELTHLRRTLSAGAKEVWEPIAGNHRLIASTKGCRFCPAKPLCPAQAAPVLEFAGLVDEDPKGLDNDVVFDLYRQLPALRAFMKSLEEHVEEESDESLEAFSFIRKEGAKKRSWNADDEEVVTLLESLGVSPYTEALKSPAKIEKELGSDDLIAAHVKIEHNKPKIVSTKPGVKTFKVGK